MLLQKVISLDWQSSTKLVIHFGDAPAHGSKYYTSCSDNHPSGDPTGSMSLQEPLFVRIAVQQTGLHRNCAAVNVTEFFVCP